MAVSPDAAQAAQLRDELWDHITTNSRKLETAER